MSHDCQRWTSQLDRVALGETLTTDELQFQREHAASCAACRVEHRFWQALSGSLEQPALLTSPPDLCADTERRAPWTKRLARRVSGAGRVRLALLAAALLGGLTALVLAVLPAEQTPLAQPSVPAPAAKPARLAFVSGEARVNRRPVAAGHELWSGDVLEVSSGQVCLLVPPAVTVCATQGTSLAVSRLSGPERRLKLHSGYVLARLATQPPGTSFGVDTDAGPLVAKGTIFAVEASRGEGVRLRVHEGTVVKSGTQPFVAPAAARFGERTERGALSGESIARDKPLIELARFWPEEATCMLDVRATPHGGRVALDGVELGRTPLSGLVRAGSYRLTLTRPGFAPVAERLALNGAERVVRNYELVPLADPSPEPVAPQPARGAAPVERAPSASALLAEARKLRAAGRFSEATATYARLVAQHPRSAEAKAALVSLGELQLTQLGDAAAALQSFDAYLRSGGGLSQEASYGRIRALRKLGRHAEERAAIARFIADYPRSVQAASLRARLARP